jgi:hypothetical protein
MGCGDVSSKATEGGRLDMLMLARGHDCPWDEQNAALMPSGCHGCPWREDIEDLDLDGCALAARGGHLEVLRWVPKHHCPQNERKCWRELGRAPGRADVGAGAGMPVG